MITFVWIIRIVGKYLSVIAYYKYRLFREVNSTILLASEENSVDLLSRGMHLSYLTRRVSAGMVLIIIQKL